MRFGSVKLSILLTIALFVLPQFVSAQSCLDIYQIQAPLRYGQLKPGFQHNNRYSVLVPNQSSVKDQCSLGTCHLHSWVSMLERDYKEKYKQDISISTQYLSARWWLNRSLKALEDEPEHNLNKTTNRETVDITVGLGSIVVTSRDHIKKFGIIPAEAWTQGDAFQRPPVVGKTKSYIENILGRYHWNKSRISDSEQKERLLKEAEDQILDIFDNLVGPFPESFIFKGKSYTPQSFMTEHFKMISRPVVRMQLADKADAKTTLENKKNNDIVVTTQMKEIEKTARALLDQGKNIYLAYQQDSAFTDHSSGILSISGFHVPSMAKPLSREQRIHFGKNSGHAVQVVGYDADPITGAVIKWKIKNSWGTKDGDQGYYHMYADYFREFVRSINFYNDGSVLLPRD